MLHFWTDSRMVYVEKRRENTSQIASSACLRSSRSIGHHYVNVMIAQKQSGKKWYKNQSFANKNRRYQLKNFKSINPIRRQRILQPSFHIQWWWDGWGGGGMGGGESRKMCVPLEKSWLHPWLERKWSIDSSFRLGSSHVVSLISLIHEVKDNIPLYKSKKRFSFWTISVGKIRRLMLEESRDFVKSSDEVEPGTLNAAEYPR